MVTTGTFLAFAASSAGWRPSEFSGATTSSCAPRSNMDLMSLICLFRSLCALVTSSLSSAIPSFAASSLMDWVSAVRNGLASFSDWEKPMTADFTSTFGYPVLSSVQPGPDAWDAAAEAAGPALVWLVVSASRLVQAVSATVSVVTASRAAFVRRTGGVDIGGSSIGRREPRHQDRATTDLHRWYNVVKPQRDGIGSAVFPTTDADRRPLLA